MLAVFVFSPAHITRQTNSKINGQINRKMTP